MYSDNRKKLLNLMVVNQITLLFGLSVYLDRTSAQRIGSAKVSKVNQCRLTVISGTRVSILAVNQSFVVGNSFHYTLVDAWIIVQDQKAALRGPMAGIEVDSGTVGL